MDVQLYTQADEAEPDVSMSRLTQAFQDPALERQFWRDEGSRGRSSLRDAANAGLGLMLTAAAVLRFQLRLPTDHAMLRLVLIGAVIMLLFRLSAMRMTARPRVMLPLFAMVITALTVASPLVMADVSEQAVLVRYGYAGLMLASIMIFLLLRLRLSLALLINGAGIALYAVLIYGIDWFPPHDRVIHVAHTLLAMITCAAGGRSLQRLSRETFAQRHLLAWREGQTRREQQRSDALLLNVMPGPIAARLKGGESPLADAHAEVSVLFADIVGFTPFSSSLPAPELVTLLDHLFAAFDDLATEAGIEKIKTIGDAYMAVAGVPSPRQDHVAAAARLALGLRDQARAISQRAGHPLELRIGIATGAAVAGVIGRRRFAYDLWGEVVDTAARMESHGAPGRIQVTAAVAERLRGSFDLEERGVVAIKGAGKMRTFWLNGPSAVDPPTNPAPHAEARG